MIIKGVNWGRCVSVGLAFGELRGERSVLGIGSKAYTCPDVQKVICHSNNYETLRWL